MAVKTSKHTYRPFVPRTTRTFAAGWQTMAAKVMGTVKRRLWWSRLKASRRRPMSQASPEAAINALLRYHTPWYIKLGVKLGLLAPLAHRGRRSPEADAALIEAFLLAGKRVFNDTSPGTPQKGDAP